MSLWLRLNSFTWTPTKINADLKSNDYKLQITKYKLKIANYKLKITKYKLQINSSMLKEKMAQVVFNLQKISIEISI